MKMRNALAIVLLAFAPAALAADFGLRAGRYQDAGEKFVGAEVAFDIGVLTVNPNIEYSLADDGTAGTANLDVTLEIARFASITPYVGAGVGLQYVDAPAGGEQTDVLGNLIGGIAFNLDTFKPYAQIKYFRTLEDDGDSDDFALTIGLRF